MSQQGHHVTTIGKLHYTQATLEKAFADQRLPMYVVEGVAVGHLRGQMPIRVDSRQHVEEAGPGESEYVRYDRAIARAAARWLREEAHRYDSPWVLLVSLATPHFPLRVPERYLALYPLDEVPLPVDWKQDDWPRHPALDAHRRLQDQERPFGEIEIRRAIAAYYGLVTFMDEQLGCVLNALSDSGFESSTRIIYTSDHGDSLGEHGLWWKSNMYEGASGVPLVIAGPDVPTQRVCATPVSLVDMFPTIVDGVGVPTEEADEDLPGESLWQIAASPDADRAVFSEYHDAYSEAGVFMLRTRNMKYVYYVGGPPQLFDLERDPLERVDLARDPAMEEILSTLDSAMREIVDPEKVDAEARAHQRERVEREGGLKAVAGRHRHTYTPAPEQFEPENLAAPSGS